MLSLSYEDIVIRDPFEVLQLVIYSDMDQQRQICRQYIRSFDLRDEEVRCGHLFIHKFFRQLINSFFLWFVHAFLFD